MKKTEIVICGIAGIATACYLSSRCGRKNIVLMDRDQPKYFLKKKEARSNDRASMIIALSQNLPAVRGPQIPVTTFIIRGSAAWILQADAQSIRIRWSNLVDELIENIDGAKCQVEMIVHLITHLGVKEDG